MNSKRELKSTTSVDERDVFNISPKAQKNIVIKSRSQLSNPAGIILGNPGKSGRIINGKIIKY